MTLYVWGLFIFLIFLCTLLSFFSIWYLVSSFQRLLLFFIYVPFFEHGLLTVFCNIKFLLYIIENLYREFD